MKFANEYRLKFQNPGVKILTCRFNLLKRWSFANVSNPYWRLYWNDRPGGTAHFKGKNYSLTPGNFMVIPPDTPFGASLSRPVKHFWLTFTTDFTYNRREIHEFPVTPEQQSILDTMLRMKEHTPLENIRDSVLALSLAHMAISRIPQDGFEQQHSDARLTGVLRHMEEHLDEIIPNQVLADLAGMNVNAFIRMFRKATNVTPQVCHAQMKIRQACLLLEYSQMSIEAVAERTGFCDRYHFSRIFRKYRDIGPATYRRLSASYSVTA